MTRKTASGTGQPIKKPKKTVKKAPVKKVESEEKKAMKKAYQKYIKSADFEKVRQAVLKRDDYRCRFCGITQEECADQGLFLSIHHASYRFCGCADQREIDDCITLCNSCHFQGHKNRRRLKHFGEKGQIEKNVADRINRTEINDKKDK